MKRIPIVIPFYRQHDKLKRCLAAIEAQTYRPTEVFVRDNSHDNIYFTAAVNEGLGKYACRSDVEHILVLNQDAYLRPDALAHLAAHMEARPDCGIACPLQMNADGITVSWGGSMQAFPSGHHRGEPLENYTAPFETYWANGAAMLIRVALIREIGVLDKNLRFIGSDADYSFTARARGWRVMGVPAAKVEHELSGSSDDSPVPLNIIKVKDMIYFGEKWLSGGLYKSLAFERAALTRISVKFEMDRLKIQLRALEELLAGYSPT